MTGRTTDQMINAPMGAIYVWHLADIRYPKQLARRLGRTDLRFMSVDDLEAGKLLGLQYATVMLDHYAANRLSERAHTALWEYGTRPGNRVVWF